MSESPSTSGGILVCVKRFKAVFRALVCRYHDGDAYIIDVSQSVEHDHPHALEFLRKDCSNVNGECEENMDRLFSVHVLSFI